LAVLTSAGRKAFDAAMARQLPWAKHLGAPLRSEDIETALAVLRTIRTRAAAEPVRKSSARRTKSGA
jgi:hypothetical protein